MENKMRIGTRSSTMALAQTNEAASQLRAAFADLSPEVVRFSPRGDRDQIGKLQTHGGKGGAFVAEIRDAMRSGALDAAMHSLKDMPGDEEAPGLVVGAYLKREAAEDVLVLRDGVSRDWALSTGLTGMKIGTNAVRRAAMVRRLYPEAEVIHYRGAVDTRLRKLDAGAMQQLPDGSHVGPADALIVAKAGLYRVAAADRIAWEFTIDEMLPAVGQGVVALECRNLDFRTRERLSAVSHAETAICALAEREVLWLLNGHCNAPIAGHACIIDGRLSLRAAVMSLDGRTMIEARAHGDCDRPREVGRAAAMDLLSQGAAALIDAAIR